MSENLMSSFFETYHPTLHADEQELLIEMVTEKELSATLDQLNKKGAS